MTFGDAIDEMKAGAFVARLGWNGKHQFIYMVSGHSVDIKYLRGSAKKAMLYRIRMEGVTPVDNKVVINPHIDMVTEDCHIVCGWLASQTDMTATDWYVKSYNENIPEANNA